MKPEQRKKDPGEIEVTMEDVELIMGKDFNHVDIYLTNFYCPNCSIIHQKRIVNFTICLNEQDEILFYGECSRCQHFIANYIETANSPTKRAMARHIRKVKEGKF